MGNRVSHTVAHRATLKKDFAYQTPKIKLAHSMKFFLAEKISITKQSVIKIINKNSLTKISQDTIVLIIQETVLWQIFISLYLSLVVTLNKSI